MVADARSAGDGAGNPIGVGLVGYGLGGRTFHAPFVAATPGMILRAVVSRDPGKVHADLPAVSVVPGVEQLLALPDIDLVIVSSPDELHARHALAALAAGKHVVVDKPFATSLADARTVADAAVRAKRLLAVFHNRRWDADFLTLRRLASSGELGRIVHFESHFDRWRPVVAPVWKEARGGGAWLDLGPHLVDQAICLFGRPSAITLDLATLRDGAPAPDWFHAVLAYPGCRAILHSSKLAAEHGLRFAVHGTRGSWLKHGFDTQEASIIAGMTPTDGQMGLDAASGRFVDGQDREHPRIIANARGDYRQFWTALKAALRGRGANPVPASEALVVMEMLEAGLESAAQGRTIAL